MDMITALSSTIIGIVFLVIIISLDKRTQKRYDAVFKPLYEEGILDEKKGLC